ncbi:MAG: ABC-2 family transporter protein [Ardenticatenaceae bacterium]|nr:ABC-2 family transporter protein [Ardenticatenaceae bacterium]
MNLPLQNTIRKYGTITLTNLQNQLAYAWDAASRSVMIMLFMFIFVQLWTAVYENKGTSTIAGLTLANTIWYFLFAEMVELGKFRHDQTISDEVKDGSIAYTLVRPYNYLAYHFANGLGETAVKMVLIFLLGAPVALYFAGWPTVYLPGLPATLLVLLLGLLIDFLHGQHDWADGLCDGRHFFAAAHLPEANLHSGRAAHPGGFLPGWLQTIARVLPFNLTTYAPAKLFVAFSWSQFGQLLAWQIGWLALLSLLLWRQYRWASRRLAVNGG